MGIFKVQFMDADEKTKNDILNTVKNEWGYPSISNFLDMITHDMVKNQIIIIKTDSATINDLLKKVREKNFDSIEDWFKMKMREEIHG